VDEFRAHLPEPVRAFGAEVGERLAGGVRQRAETSRKRRDAGPEARTAVTPPD
jgi:hypothetical protein